MDYPILGEWYALWQFTILKMCVHEEYHLVLIYQYYLISMWYVMLMRNSNSIMSINYLLLDYILPLVNIKWITTLWGSNKLCAYYKPRKCEHVRYCHLELIFSIILFLCGMLLKQVPIWLNDLTCSIFGSCLWRMFLVWFSHNIFTYISLGNRLLQATLCSGFAW